LGCKAWGKLLQAFIFDIIELMKADGSEFSLWRIQFGGMK
jgi:hypothetical protein